MLINIMSTETWYFSQLLLLLYIWFYFVYNYIIYSINITTSNDCFHI